MSTPAHLLQRTAMNIFNREVQSYRVFISRGSGSSIRRQINLQLSGGGPDDIRVRFLPSPSSDYVQLFTSFGNVELPLSDYEEVYHLLQTEHPVYFTAYHFGTSLQFAGFSTDPEGAGEGFTDPDA